ncbi:MAG: 5-formyltetrahydrofolate cyclo-ligase [Pseudomonadales bacterium]
MTDPSNTEGTSKERTAKSGTSLRGRLRKQYRSARRALPESQQDAHATAVVRHFANSKLAQQTGSVGLFVSQDGELPTGKLINHCLADQLTVALPCIGADSRLSFRAYALGAPLVTGAYGLLEPTDAASVIALADLQTLFMPLVAYDDQGNRLGMGGGYYDRMLGQLAGEERPLLVGLCHQLQHCAQSLPSESWDIPLDAVLTESGWRNFSTRAEAALGYTAPPSETQ